MFSGIIEAIGTVEAIKEFGQDHRFVINTGKLDLSDINESESIAVSGVCLTVIEMSEKTITADVSIETLACTTFGTIQPGDKVNLEKALQLSSRLNGHLVIGHVDGVGKVLSLTDEGRSICYEIQFPDSLKKYIARKGSICVDGVSLTVNETSNTCFKVNIIPHTLKETIFSDYVEGSSVNLEIDLIARYLEGLLHEE
jgi:riboflavin synthase